MRFSAQYIILPEAVVFPQVFTNDMQRVFVPNFSAVKRTFPNGERGMLGVQHRRRHHPFAAPREPVEYIRFMLPIREEKMNMIRHNDEFLYHNDFGCLLHRFQYSFRSLSPFIWFPDVFLIDGADRFDNLKNQFNLCKILT